MRHLHYRDALCAGSVQRPQMREKIGRRLNQVATWRKVKDRTGKSRRRTEGEQRFTRLSGLGIKPDCGLRCVVRRQHAGRDGCVFGNGSDRQRAAKRALDHFAGKAARPQQGRLVDA